MPKQEAQGPGLSACRLSDWTTEVKFCEETCCRNKRPKGLDDLLAACQIGPLKSNLCLTAMQCQKWKMYRITSDWP